MEKFSWNWKYPSDFDNMEIRFDEKGINKSHRNKNGVWSGRIIDLKGNRLKKELENEYQKKYKREEKLKRILNGKI